MLELERVFELEPEQLRVATLKQRYTQRQGQEMVGVKLKALDIVVGGQSLALVVGECLPGALLHLGEIQDTVGSLMRVRATVAGAEPLFMLNDLDPGFPSAVP